MKVIYKSWPRRNSEVAAGSAPITAMKYRQRIAHPIGCTFEADHREVVRKQGGNA
ncbi:hypothetical protein [uncultured Secundilactobacillus sp.]|uniref:hypothetical protein n=1 Tax=uncultured Secundilactobacillus sp. TaxID=2813935 RepID=UPI00258F9B02|nr:hypothetical protein [uncultured Secundilactobacillus sp.]